MSAVISKHFSYDEVTVTTHREIPNTPSVAVMETIVQTAQHMEAIREYLGFPILISSWYRSPPLCVAIGSKVTSQHPKGEATDWSCPGYGSVEDVARLLATRTAMRRFKIDQLILERRNKAEWLHTSFAINPAREPRYQVLTLLASGGYATGLTDIDGKRI